MRRLSVENVNLAGGDIKEGDTQYLVRTVNEFGSVEEISELVVARAGGRDLTAPRPGPGPLRLGRP